MSRSKKDAIPSYRLHKARNCAVVTLDGKDHYLGPFNSPSSKQKYAKLIRAWLSARETPPDDRPETPSLPISDRPCIGEIILRFLQYASAYYKPNHGENREAGCIADALQVLRECGYGGEPADAFRASDLKKVREAMVEKKWSRKYINSQVNRVKRMFGYAVEEDWLSGSVYHGLLAVRGLRKGTPGVRETAKIKPIPIAHLKAVLAKAQPMIKAMILFAYYTGARPGEVCALRLGDLDRSKKVWLNTTEKSELFTWGRELNEFSNPGYVGSSRANSSSARFARKRCDNRLDELSERLPSPDLD
jgi:integrase